MADDVAVTYSNARHLVPLDFKLYPLEQLSPTQLALAVLHPDWDETRSSSTSIYRLFSRLRERARSTTLPSPDISDKDDTLHLIDLSFEIPRVGMDGLNSDQLLALPWHPESNDTLELAALRELWRRRERDTRNNVKYSKTGAAPAHPTATVLDPPSAATPPRPATPQVTAPVAVVKQPPPSSGPVPEEAAPPQPVAPSRSASPTPAPPQQLPQQPFIPQPPSSPPAPRAPSRPPVEQPPRRPLPPLPASRDHIRDDLANSHLHTLLISNLPPGIVNTSRHVFQLFEPALAPAAAIMLRPDPVRSGEVPAPRKCFAAWLDFDQRTAAMQTLVTMRIASRWVPEVEIVEGRRARWEWGDLPDYKDRMELWRKYHDRLRARSVEQHQRQRQDGGGGDARSRDSRTISSSPAPQQRSTRAATPRQDPRQPPAEPPRQPAPAHRPRSVTPERPRPPAAAAPVPPSPAAAPASATIAPVASAAPPREVTPPRPIATPFVHAPAPHLPRRPDLPDVQPPGSSGSQDVDGVPIQSESGSQSSIAPHASVPTALTSKLCFLLFGSKRALPSEDDRSGSYAARINAHLGPFDRLAGAQAFEKKRAVLLAFEDDEDRESAIKILSPRTDKQYVHRYGDLPAAGDAPLSEPQRKKRDLQRKQTEEGWEWRQMTSAYRAAYERQGPASVASGSPQASTLSASETVQSSWRAAVDTQQQAERSSDLPARPLDTMDVDTGVAADSRKRPASALATGEQDHPHKHSRGASQALGELQGSTEASTSVIAAPLNSSAPTAQSVASSGTPPPPAPADDPAFDPLLDDEGRPLPTGWLRCWSVSQAEWYYQSPDEGTTWKNPLEPPDIYESEEDESGTPPIDGAGVVETVGEPMDLDSDGPEQAHPAASTDLEAGIAAPTRPAIHFSLAPASSTSAGHGVSAFPPYASQRASAVPTLAARAASPIGIRGVGPGISSGSESIVLSDTLADRLTNGEQQQQQQQLQGNGKRARRGASSDYESGAGNGLLDRLDDSGLSHTRDPSPAPTRYKGKQQNSNNPSSKAIQRNASNNGTRGNNGINSGGGGGGGGGVSLTSRIQGNEGRAPNTRKGGKGNSNNGVQVGNHVVSNSSGAGGGNAGAGARARQASNGENLLKRMQH